ncbi:retinol dehydrogenase 12 isoform X2 [Rhipicephalus microplus]|uniref:retinol dehydrogenase 12 isoform X2 n=1 Tax=Rhipicephalus microplus TaxID=6941 RepID=UPI003F6D1F33
MPPVAQTPTINFKRLIELVRPYPYLYNRQEPKFKDVALKNQRWNMIGAEFGITGDHAAQKFRTMRTKYQDLKRMNDASRYYGKYVGRPRWRYYDLMDEFLRGNEDTPNPAPSETPVMVISNICSVAEQAPAVAGTQGEGLIDPEVGHSTLVAVDELLLVGTRCVPAILVLLVVITCVTATVFMFKALSRKTQKAEKCTTDSQDAVDMRGKTVVVTGGNAGIGFETALQLSRLGARVIVACRCESKGRAAVEAIRRATGNDRVEFALLDVGSLSSVRRFANELLATEERLDVLVNNAGITDIMKRSGPSRVVNVTSSLYRLGRVPWDQLETAARGGASFEYPGVESTYASSKLLLNLFSVELARQLQGTGVTCNAVHPGVVSTDFNQKEPGFRHFLWNAFLHTFGTSPRKGARGPVHLASSPKLHDVSGKYFVSCRQSSWSRKVLDEETAHKVWCRSADLVRAVLEDVDKESSSAPRPVVRNCSNGAAQEGPHCGNSRTPRRESCHGSACDL